MKPPCPGCPWRVDQLPDVIPGFSLEMAEDLADTAPDEKGHGPEWGAPLMACHHSRPGEEFPCAGWLAVVGHRHPRIKLGVLRGEYPEEALRPAEGWPALHGSFQEMLEKLREAEGG